jgi:hypothetical protein
MPKEMKMGKMPKEHWEKSMETVDSCNSRYTDGDFSNPENLKKNADGLANYVRKNRETY